MFLTLYDTSVTSYLELEYCGQFLTLNNFKHVMQYFINVSYDSLIISLLFCIEILLFSWDINNSSES